TVAQFVGVHRQTHGATRLTPFETGFKENLVQTFLFRLFFHQTRARYRQRLLNSGSHFTAFGHFRSGAQVFDPGVGAGTDEHTVQLNAGHWLTGLQPHVLVGTLERRALHVVFGIVQRRYGSVDGGHHLRRSTPGDLRLDVFGTDFDDLVEFGIVVRHQILPRLQCHLPVRPLRSVWAAFHVLGGFFIKRHQTYTGTGFNGHVAHGHTGFHARSEERRVGQEGK